MAAKLQTTNLSKIPSMKIGYFRYFFIEAPVTWGGIDEMSTWVKIMAWCRTGDRPLSKPMMTQISDAE